MAPKDGKERPVWNCHYTLPNKTEERRSQPSRRYDNNTKIDHKDTGCEGMNWV